MSMPEDDSGDNYKEDAMMIMMKMLIKVRMNM